MIRPSLPKELDAICQKSLSFDRRERFPSADELRAELQRYLRGEPICAIRYSRVQRFVKLCRRHPAISILLGAFLTTVLFAVVGLWGLYCKAEAERQRASALFQRAVLTVDKLEAIAHSSHTNLPGGTALLREVDRETLTFYEDFASSHGGSTVQLNQSLGLAYQHIGSNHQTEGNTSAARTSFLKAIELLEDSLTREPDDPNAVNRLLAAKHLLAKLEIECGNIEDGRRLLQYIVDRRRELVERDPESMDLRHQLADSLCEVGFFYVGQRDHKEALQYLTQAEKELRRLREKSGGKDQASVSLAIVMNRIGLSLGFDRQNSEAVPFHHNAIELMKPLVEKHPTNIGHRRELASAHFNLARSLRNSDKPTAEHHHQEALIMRRWLVAASPDTPDYFDDLADSLRIFGTFLGDQNRHHEAEKMLVEAREIWVKLAASAPAVEKYSRRLAECEKKIIQFDPSR